MKKNEEFEIEEFINPITLDSYFFTDEDFIRIDKFIQRENEKNDEIIAEEMPF